MKVTVELEVDSPHVPHLLGKIAEIAHRVSEIEGVEVLDVKQNKPGLGQTFIHNNSVPRDVWSQVVDTAFRKVDEAHRQRGTRG